MSELKNPVRICPNCKKELVVEAASYPMGSAFLTNRFHVDICSCPQCGKVELYAAKSDMVTCPVCGTSHHAQEKCVTCALDVAFGGRRNQ